MKLASYKLELSLEPKSVCLKVVHYHKMEYLSLGALGAVITYERVEIRRVYLKDENGVCLLALISDDKW
jgi:hypothetical protein